MLASYSAAHKLSTEAVAGYLTEDMLKNRHAATHTQQTPRNAYTLNTYSLGRILGIHVFLFTYLPNNPYSRNAHMLATRSAAQKLSTEAAAGLYNIGPNEKPSCRQTP